MSVVQFPKPGTAHARFCAERKRMMRSFQAWLEEGATVAEAEAEASGTAAAIEGIRQIYHGEPM